MPLVDCPTRSLYVSAPVSAGPSIGLTRVKVSTNAVVMFPTDAFRVPVTVSFVTLSVVTVSLVTLSVVIVALVIFALPVTVVLPIFAVITLANTALALVVTFKSETCALVIDVLLIVELAITTVAPVAFAFKVAIFAVTMFPLLMLARLNTTKLPVLVLEPTVNVAKAFT